MEELLVAILQALFEFVLEVLAYSGGPWPFESRDLFPETLAGACALWFVGGCALAGLSLLVFNHTYIPLSSLRMVNVFAAPLSSAYISQAIARRRATSGTTVFPRYQFWKAFWFTLGITLVRFAFAVRL